MDLESSRLQRELTFSLRFHHRNILTQLPRDLALQAMNEAYESLRLKDAACEDGM